MFGTKIKTFKSVFIAAAVIAVVGLLAWLFDERYDAGYRAATLEVEQQTLAAVNEAVQTARAEWLASEKVAMDAAEKETEIIEVIRHVYRDIPTVEVSDQCTDLGPDFLSVFNRAIEAGSRPDQGAGAP